ncbi:MAG: AAA family ATPase [Paracoccus aminovorans]|nr:AAA family ATPase [Paracoccus aminovorans]
MARAGAAERPLPGVDYGDTAQAFYDLLENETHGVLIPDRALARPAQLVYLPNRGEYYEPLVVRGRLLALADDHPIIALRDENRRVRRVAEAEARAWKASIKSKPRSDAGSVIELFNRAHPVENLLARYGYTRAGRSNDWRSPAQTSKSYATRCYGDFWVSLSASDAAERLGRETPSGARYGDAFDLFVHFEHGGNMRDAVRNYAEESGISRNSSAEAPDPGVTAPGQPANSPAPVFRPTTYVWREPEQIPPRQWVFNKHLIREYVSLTVAPGALGKSSMLAVEMLAMVTGKPLMGEAPPFPLRVWAWNGEDPRDELDRRFQAACKHYGITREDIGDRYMNDSGRDVPINIASAGRDGIHIAIPIVDALIAAIKAAKVDVFVVDPFVTSHSVPENDTTAINTVVAQWRHIADTTGCAIELVHHVSKAAALDSDGAGIYGSRGAGALIDGVRSARYLARMSKEEGERFGVEDYERHFRVQMGKANLAPADKASWRKMIGVPLHNGASYWPDGDVIGVCTEWTPPDAFEGMTSRDLQKVQNAVDSCEAAPKASEIAAEWVGYVVADALGLDAGRGLKKRNAAANNTETAPGSRAMLAAWMRSGALTVEARHNPRDGRSVNVVVVGDVVTEADIRGQS